MIFVLIVIYICGYITINFLAERAELKEHKRRMAIRFEREEKEHAANIAKAQASFLRRWS